MGALLLAALATSASVPALAQAVVVSAAPLATSVTVYRDPNRSEGGRIDLRWPNGYALISEKRRIVLPAGESVVRFEGVAGGMIAVSAVVSGLPGGVSEKNRDARLLSPAALLDGSLGNRVHIRRTNRQTGKVSEEEAIVRSGANGAVALQTAQGVEALRCSGLPETLVYDAVPEGLSAKPSFSVHTNTPGVTTAEVTLTYLATGFDWGASYVAKVAQDGRSLDLFAWLTLANGNDVLYPDAQLLAVAGKPNRTSDFDALAPQLAVPTLRLSCWPMDGTSTHDSWGMPSGSALYEMAMMPPPPVAMAMAMKSGDVVVSAQRMAQQEDLGDLKLYRVPMPVDIAPNGQKQVALLSKQSVPFSRFYGVTLSPWDDALDRPLEIRLRMQNKAKDGLGLPLPSGGVVVMQRGGDTDLLLADARIGDYAIGEKVELAAGVSDQLRLSQSLLSASARERRILITLSNALDKRAPVEIGIARADGWTITPAKGRLSSRDGKAMWITDVPANGTARLELILARQN